MCIRDRHYIEGQHTFFILENLDTLRKNGRLSKVKALVASALKIKPVMGSTDDGNICQLDQARGMDPVSYTHLDVYKRQELRRPEPTH